MGQAVPEIPLSVGSKLELLRALSLPNFRILPRTFTHLSAYAYYICCLYRYTMYVYIILVVIYTMNMTEVPRVLHF